MEIKKHLSAEEEIVERGFYGERPNFSFSQISFQNLLIKEHLVLMATDCEKGC